MNATAIAEDLRYNARLIGSEASRAGVDWGALAAALIESARGVERLASPWRDTEEAANHVRLSPRTLAGYRRKGGGPRYSRQGGRVAYDVADLDAWRRAGVAANTTAERLAGVALPG